MKLYVLKIVGADAWLCWDSYFDEWTVWPRFCDARLLNFKPSSAEIENYNEQLEVKFELVEVNIEFKAVED